MPGRAVAGVAVWVAPGRRTQSWPLVPLRSFHRLSPVLSSWPASKFSTWPGVVLVSLLSLASTPGAGTLSGVSSLVLALSLPATTASSPAHCCCRSVLRAMDVSMLPARYSKSQSPPRCWLPVRSSEAAMSAPVSQARRSIRA